MARVIERLSDVAAALEEIVASPWPVPEPASSGPAVTTFRSEEKEHRAERTGALREELQARPGPSFPVRLPRRMYDVTARRHDQHPGGEPVNAGKRTSIAAKAAAIDAAQARPLTWKAVVKRALAVAVAGAGIYLVLNGPMGHGFRSYRAGARPPTRALARDPGMPHLCPTMTKAV